MYTDHTTGDWYCKDCGIWVHGPLTNHLCPAYQPYGTSGIPIVDNTWRVDALERRVRALEEVIEKLREGLQK